MKFSYFFLAASIGFLAACSGFERDFPDEISDNVEITEIVFHVLPVIDDDCVETKASSVPRTDYNVSFAWEETDKIGIFPNQGSQIYFVPEDGVGTNSASFTGGGWALKPNSTYVSYFPFVADFYLDRNAIPVSFAGQRQKGTEGPFDGARWILATDPVQSQNGRLTFTYNILNTIINVLATLPAGTYTSASLNMAEPLFVEEGTFSLDDQEIVGTAFSKTLEVELEDFTLTNNAEVPIYFMAAPVDLTGKEITVIITKDDGTRYKCVKTPSAPYNAGRRRGLTCAMQKVAEIINFVDPAVKALCVANWDTDGDGELDMDEAAAVTDIGAVFYGNDEIVSFDEFQFFTGVTELSGVKRTNGTHGVDGSFEGCLNLTSIILPESITSIGKDAFSYCRSLTSINIPEGCTIGICAFYATDSIQSFVFPECIIDTSTGGSSDFVLIGREDGNNRHISSSVSFTGPLYYKGNGYAPIIGVFEHLSLYFGENFSFSSDGLSLYDAFISYGYMGNGPTPQITIVVSPDNPIYDSRQNCNAFIETASNTLLFGCNNTSIPETVTSIASMALAACGLTDITIPESVSSIYYNAFSENYELNSITVLAQTPPTIVAPGWSEDSIHLFLSSQPSIYVPAGSVNAYKTAVGWSYYADRIYSMEEYDVPDPGDDGND